VNILLTTDLDDLADRARSNDRPRVDPRTTLAEDLAQIWGTHQDLYLGFADIVDQTERGKTVAQEVDELLEALRRDCGIHEEEPI